MMLSDHFWVSGLLSTVNGFFSLHFIIVLHTDVLIMEKKKILLVDDNPDITRTIGSMLEATDRYVIREENIGTRALETARNFKPDLVFLDFMMPDIDGNEVAAQFEEDDELKSVKIVFLTAIVTKKEIESGSVNNISGYMVLAKPVKTKELISCIEELIGE